MDPYLEKQNKIKTKVDCKPSRGEEIQAHGVRALGPYHPVVLKLKRCHLPWAHGNRIWMTSWLLIDFLVNRGLSPGDRVMEVGCGWGLVGIYCARSHGVPVTAVDLDPAVFPYLDLHARLNHVRIAKLESNYRNLSTRRLDRIDVLLGADVCFWDYLAPGLAKLISRALNAGVRTVLIADPGRSPFYAVAELFTRQGRGSLIPWTSKHPSPTRGYILCVEDRPWNHNSRNVLSAGSPPGGTPGRRACGSDRDSA
jgi:hypothetical protein